MRPWRKKCTDTEAPDGLRSLRSSAPFAEPLTIPTQIQRVVLYASIASILFSPELSGPSLPSGRQALTS